MWNTGRRLGHKTGCPEVGQRLFGVVLLAPYDAAVVERHSHVEFELVVDAPSGKILNPGACCSKAYVYRHENPRCKVNSSAQTP